MNKEIVIPRVTCPRCNTPMRLSSVAPELDGEDVLTFDCDCRFEYHMSARVVLQETAPPASRAAPKPDAAAAT
jgi:hypothetical protein